MNPIAHWQADLARLPGIEMEHWHSFEHQSQRQELGEAQLGDALRSVGEISGWLSEPSRVLELRRQAIELQQLPLAGEFFRNQDGALHCWQLHHHARGQWALTHHRIAACPAEQANCLGQRTTQLHARTATQRLAYWRLWRADAADHGAPHAFAALLCAIEEPRA